MQKGHLWSYSKHRKAPDVRKSAAALVHFLEANEREAGISHKQGEINRQLQGDRCVVCGMECSNLTHFGLKTCVDKMWYDLGKYEVEPTDGKGIENRWFIYPGFNEKHVEEHGVQLVVK